MGRPKKPTAQLASIADANAALLTLLKAEIELEKNQGAMDLARAAATSKWEQSIEASKMSIADLTAQLQAWYMGNLTTLEQDRKKSVQLAYGTIGRRLGNHVLKPLNRAWTWAAIGNALRALYPGRFFHAPAEPAIDKETVRKELRDVDLKNCGLKVEQDEKFFVETDRTTLGNAA